MSTREENLKKINAELEKMSDEELDKVAGGTTSESIEVMRTINANPKFKETFFKESTDKMFVREELLDSLKKAFNVDYKQRIREANIYKRGNENLTHQQVIEMIKNYE